MRSPERGRGAEGACGFWNIAHQLSLFVAMYPDPGPLQPLFYVTLSLLYSCATSDLHLRFVTEPVSTVQRSDGPVQLFCSAEPFPANISWLFNGERLDEGSDGFHLQAGSLTILSLSLSNAGHYKCIASNAAGAILSKPATVSIARIEDFEATAKAPILVVEGNTAFVTCNIPDSNPRALVRYRIRGKWLAHSTDNYVILPSGNLQILNVSLEDRGSYKCAAYNPVTHEQKVDPTGHKIIVSGSISEASAIIYPKTSQILTIQKRSSLTLECVVSGRTSHVHWLKEGQQALVDGRLRMQETHLVIEETEDSDAGNYSCVIGNGIGERRRANYTVQIVEPAFVSQGLKDQNLSSGNTARFMCDLRGNPSPSLNWFHNAVPVRSSPRYVMSGNRLRINAATTEDSGMYQCTADNGIGFAQSTARLRVQPGRGSKPIIVSAPASAKVLDGDFVTLSCNASGVPPPLIRWYNSRGLISSHPSHVLKTKSQKSLHNGAAASLSDPVHLTVSRAGSSTLYIRAITAEHSGKYTCEATNDHGSAASEAFLTVVPFETSTKAEEYTPMEIAQSDEGDYEYDTGLHNVAPTDWQGVSPATEKVSSVASPPDAPIILSPPRTLKPDEYHLMWSSGKDGGFPINAYFVKYRKLEDGGSLVGRWHTVRVPGSEHEHRITELEPLSLYEVLMVARNAAGEGQPAMLTFRTSKVKNLPAPSSKPPVQEGANSNFGVVLSDTSRHSAAPEAPARPMISTASESSVYVTWVPRANGGFPITSFKVEYKRNGEDWQTAADNISPSEISVEVSRLEPGAVYSFRVISMNHYGESMPSHPSRPYQVPGFGSGFTNRLIIVPHIDHTEAVSDTEILLKWTYIPSNNNTPIQGLYIYYRPTDSDNDSDYKRDQVEGSKQKHLISHLQPETSYDIKMQCYNEGGESDYSNVMMCETKAKRVHGSSDYPVEEQSTPPTSGGGKPDTSNAITRSSDMLYLIVGCVLGVMVLILIVFIAICLWKNRQQNLMQKYDPPGYIYQGADVNGHLVEYTTLPGTSRINGSIHGNYLSNGCPHLHHKMSNGVNGTLNGRINGGPGPFQGCSMEYDQSQQPVNGGGLYSPVLQRDPTECINCRNCCNNNRCFTKTNGNLNTSILPVMPIVASFQQDNLEMKRLNHVMVPMCLASSVSECSGEEELDNTLDLRPAQNICCRESQNHMCADSIEGDRNHIFSWASLISPPLHETCLESSSGPSAGCPLDSLQRVTPQTEAEET
ncbi:cell adhesion molecule-related/down-regulated by oncogenes isoform X2 [Ambystoma mexicanum]|uniref:cell adhesion molecule-related/down-regulated by oncogenes isoform X2 n=1 Tax=Ambystoma mexicanum TaxID=8296 RepID=UPI0037E7C65B